MDGNVSDVLIIGGGASGLFAAARLIKECGRGLDIKILEAGSKTGRKLLLTGSGRCNLTNAVFELDDLIENVPTNPRFLYSAFSHFMPYDTMALFEELGGTIEYDISGTEICWIGIAASILNVVLF